LQAEHTVKRRADSCTRDNWNYSLDGSNTNDTNNSKDARNVGIPLAERTATAVGTRAATARLEPMQGT